MPKATTGDAAARDTNFLSRALAAFTIYKMSGCSLDEAAAAVVDGGGDGGIDAVHYEASAEKLWVVQSKYHLSGRGEPALRDVNTFKTGLENLLLGRFEAFESNATWRRLIPALRHVLEFGSLRVQAVLVYSTLQSVSDDRLHVFEGLRRQFSADTDYLECNTCNLTTLHDWATGADQSPGVPEVTLTLLKPGWVQRPYETVYGLLPLAELAMHWRVHGRRLIAANIRAYQGSTAVNSKIVDTVRNEPEHFFYLNNGLTAYCNRLELRHVDRANAESKKVKAFGLSIVNGAQTLGSVAEYFATAAEGALPEGYVFIKIISLKRCHDDRAFAESITRSTNFQNQIGTRDFVALNEQQQRLANQLAPSGISYHYKTGADTPAPDAQNFTLDEATTVAAVLTNKPDCAVCAQLATDWQAFWSFDPVFPDNLLQPSLYARTFNAELSGRVLWRAVQVQRVARQALNQGESGVRAEFFAGCGWLVLDLLFSYRFYQLGEALALSTDEQTSISRDAQDFAEKIWAACLLKGMVLTLEDGRWELPKPFQTVFGTPNDCKILRSTVLAVLHRSVTI
ncbi:AIPR family protein [Hymenobacter sp. BT664]|uniref:AIPR family protein n=1 Tax=Hymenobacter montanus TaxID=2771359 RepID=A0A927GIY7_9BACT|nr:AIPR family protein [Hymenobacter montanus]MBD2767604.1 AIPR family protein [Hymenobacter montanus]